MARGVETLDTKLLTELMQYFRRFWVLMETADGRFQVMEQSDGLKMISGLHEDPRGAIAEAALKLKRGEISVEEHSSLWSG